MQPLPPENLPMIAAALKTFPRPDLLAQQALRTWLSQRGIERSPLEIDVVTLHYQYKALGEGRDHFREDALVTQKMNLVEALLGNWQGETASGYGGFHYGNWAGNAPMGSVHLVERLELPNLFSNSSSYAVFNGLYRSVTPSQYGPDNRLAIRAEDFQSFIWGLQFHHRYIAQLDAFWNERFDFYQRAVKINFIAACNEQVHHGSLSEAGRLMAWQTAALIARDPHLRISLLNVYGYVSTSILCLHQGDSDRTLLYIPGNRYPFHEFVSKNAMRDWVAAQCQDDLKRNALLQHFSPADWPDGLDFSGLRTALRGLGVYPRRHRLPSDHPGFATSGVWQPHEIVDYRAEHYSPAIEGDVFLHIARWHQKRSYTDADSQIVSNHQIDKANWTNYLKIAMGMLLPVAMAIPALSPLLAVGGLAEFTLGLDKVMNATALADKVDGVEGQAFGLLNALPLSSALQGRTTGMFGYWRRGFFSNARVNRLLGEQMGPVAAAEAFEMEPAEVAFRPSGAALLNSQPAVIRRIDSGLLHRFSAQLALPDGLSREWVTYELDTDTFIRESEAARPDAQRWVVRDDASQALSQHPGSTRVVDDSMRMARLRSLGINLDLPIDLKQYAHLAATDIPRRISSIWTGNRHLSEVFLKALAHNALALENSAYEYELLLSRQDLTVYQDNLALIRKWAPSLEVVALEEQPFFDAFAVSPYYPHYQAALGLLPGSASNFSSACDILRYRLLDAVGGLYIDVDDMLLPPDSNIASLPPLDRVPLATTPDGLLLAPPVSNDQLGMYIQYNSSLLGSHAGNPTLTAISDEILSRYRQGSDFYFDRPDPEREPTRFNVYAHRLSHLTGPGVLNDVIDRQLPWLSQLRELCNLLASPVHDIHRQLNMSQFLRLMRQWVPLDRVASIGSAHSWAQP
ncbi:dermonecrotic toxin domain-containing protein [Pseudomonas phoenicis]|uniref:dermonecrotic toxin domain-containing protein n=1 Tax=unclassified Pseudomonas TaxID=196821 RepID=UPI0039A3160E